MDRKGIELSLNLLIIATIGMVILVILIILLTSNVRPWDKDVRSCRNKDGRCASECAPPETASSYFVSDCEKGEVCCIAPPE